MNSNEKRSFWLNVLVMKLKLKLIYWYVTCVVINVDKKDISFLFYHLSKCKELSCCVLLIKETLCILDKYTTRKYYDSWSKVDLPHSWTWHRSISKFDWCSSEDNRGTYLLHHKFDRNCGLVNHLSSLTMSCRLLHSPLCCKTLDKYWRY